jgi:hypothetical protein
LAGSFAVIGFACTRTPPASRTAANAPAPVTRAATPAAPIARAATPAAPSSKATPAQSAPPAPRSGATAAGPAGRQGSAAPAPLGTLGSRLAPIAKTPPQALPPETPPHTPPQPGRSAAPHTQPRLALIIDDCGQWLTTERGFIALPVTLTLSVLPDVRFNQTIEREAVDGNKGVMLHLPMETLSGRNPGRGKITTEMDDQAIIAQVERDLGDVDLARGVNNHEGSKATANVRVMNDLMAVLARRDRFFIDSRTNRASVAEHIATQRGVATARRDVFLDNRADVKYTEGQLRVAAAIAMRDGSAIAIGHPRPSTLAAVRAMIPELQADGIKFVLAADLAH